VQLIFHLRNSEVLYKFHPDFASLSSLASVEEMQAFFMENLDQWKVILRNSLTQKVTELLEVQGWEAVSQYFNLHPKAPIDYSSLLKFLVLIPPLQTEDEELQETYKFFVGHIVY
jgi:hypothetical protein